MVTSLPRRPTGACTRGHSGRLSVRPAPDTQIAEDAGARHRATPVAQEKDGKCHYGLYRLITQGLRTKGLGTYPGINLYPNNSYINSVLLRYLIPPGTRLLTQECSPVSLCPEPPPPAPPSSVPHLDTSTFGSLWVPGVLDLPRPSEAEISEISLESGRLGT